MQEIWKDIKGYEDKYQVSNLGRVKSKERYFKNHSKYQKVYEKFLSQRKQYGKSDNEYIIVSLTTKHKSKYKFVHRLVAEAFLDDYNEKLDVNHKDGNKSNNNIDNLEMMTRSENQLHAYNVLKRKHKGQ